MTIEGLGQYAIYAWLIHPQGEALEKAKAIQLVRRKGAQWSQDEGFAIVLNLADQRGILWDKWLFGENEANVIDVLIQQIQFTNKKAGKLKN